MRHRLRIDPDLPAGRAEVSRRKLDRFVRSAWVAVAWLVVILAGGAAVEALGLA